MKIKRILTAAIAATMMITSLTACGNSDKQNNTVTNVDISDVKTEETTEPDKCETGFTGYEYGNPIKDINYTFSSHVEVTAEHIQGQLSLIDDVDEYLNGKYREYDIKINSIEVFEEPHDPPKVYIDYSVDNRTTFYHESVTENSTLPLTVEVFQNGVWYPSLTIMDEKPEDNSIHKYKELSYHSFDNVNDPIIIRITDGGFKHCALYLEVNPSEYIEK